MSDELLRNELLKNEELDVEGHVKKGVTDEPSEDKEEDDVEGHVRKSSVRHI
jgi:hypothetical protein